MKRDEHKRPAAWLEFLERHGEKAGLGAVILIAAAYVLLGMPGNVATADPILSEVEREMGRPHRDCAPPPVAVSLPTPEVWVARPANPWAGGYVTRFKEMPLDPPPMEPVTVLAPSIRLTTAVVSPYSVQLTWSVTPPTKPEGKGKYELLGVTRLRLERRAGDGKPSVLSDDLGRTGGSQVDAGVRPNETYTYRLVGLTTGKDVVLESSSSVRLPDPWKLSFLAPAPGRVLATIEKFDRKLGRVVRIQHPQQEGERLGVWKDLGAKEPTPVHVVTIDGRAHEVDFDTGVTLLSVRKVEVPVVERKCRFDYIGTRKGPCSEVKDIGRFSTMAVDLSSEEADWTIYAPPPADRDRRCGDCKNK